MDTEQVTDQVADEPAGTPETRCCRRHCGARAFVFAEFRSGPLAWCGHHATEDWDAINAQALVVTDRRDEILPKPVALDEP